MWLMVQFDLPMDSKAHGLAYRRLRKALHCFGFDFLQKSIYARWEDSDATADVTQERLSEWIPEEGCVSIFRLTDRAMGISTFYSDGQPVPAPSPPEEYILC